jgi:prepilin-type N-terminal cleavage/methylation domain-containing protein
MDFKSGFTMVEITIVLGIIALLFSIASINLSNTYPKSSLKDAAELLIADIKQQQLESNAGIYFANEKYILFSGSSYNASNSSNYNVLQDEINFTSTAPGSTIVFIGGTLPTGYTITLTQNNTFDTVTISLNKYGIVESIL